MPASVVITEKKSGDRPGLRSSTKPADPPAPESTESGCICGKKIAKKSIKIQCGSCHRAYHADCVSLTGLQQSTLNLLTRWHCPPCVVFSKGLTISSFPSALISELVALVAAQIKSTGLLSTVASAPSPTAKPNESNDNPGPSYSEVLAPSGNSPSSSSSAVTQSNDTAEQQTAAHTEEHCTPDVSGDNETGWQEARSRRKPRTGPPLLPTPPDLAPNPPAPEVHKIVIFGEDTKATLAEVKGLLRDIPARAYEGAGRLTLLFDKKEHKEAAAGLIRVAMDSSKVQTHGGVKVTIFNVPVPEELVNEQAIEYVTEGLARKNGEVLASSDFKVVYAKRHVRRPELMNIRIRTSPEVRESLLKTGKVNFDLTRCRVEPYAYFRQCHHCQRPGHNTEDCPSRNDPPKCMYCAKDHQTASCPTKDDRGTHTCSNCDAKTHHAGYQGCPTLQNHMDEVSKNFLRTSRSRT